MFTTRVIPVVATAKKKRATIQRTGDVTVQSLKSKAFVAMENL